MGALAILMFLLLLSQGAEAAPAPTPTPPAPRPPTPPTPKPPARPPAAPAPVPAGPAAPQYPEAFKPWPVAAPAAKPDIPAGLPKFPTGWEPDVPPPAPVVQRANALLPELWRSGKSGAIKQERTAGRWITYQAYSPAKGKRGVVAYRLKGGGGGTVYS